MPIYEYVCQACGHGFEELVRTMRAPVEMTCPKCGHCKARRQLSTFAARQRTATSSSPPTGGECGCCCDPNGSCQF